METAATKATDSSPNIDTTGKDGVVTRRLRAVVARLQPAACLLGLILVVLATVAGKAIVPYVAGYDVVHVTLLYLMVVLFLAVQFGLWPALLAAIVSVGALDYLFVPPLYTFLVYTVPDFLVLVFFGIVALTASTLASRSREQMLIARRNAETRTELYRFAERLAGVVTVDAAVATAVGQIENMLHCRARIRLSADPSPLQKEMSVPLRAGGETLGEIAIQPSNDEPLLSDERKLLDMLAELTAIAIARQLLADRLARLGTEREVDRLRSALLNSFAHDLTAPISTIASVLSSLNTSYQTFDEAERRELIAEAEHEAEHLHRFSSNLVNMTRLEAGTVELQRVPTAVQELVESAMARADGLLGDRRVVLDLASDLPRLRVDAVLLQQVIFNLLENAAKYTPANATVAISAARHHDDVVLRIADSGAGFPPEDSERIFTKFYRAPQPAGGAPGHGTGLGLAICRGFIEAHGGTITAATGVDGAGAVFTITLPIEQQPADAGER